MKPERWAEIATPGVPEDRRIRRGRPRTRWREFRVVEEYHQRQGGAVEDFGINLCPALR